MDRGVKRKMGSPNNEKMDYISKPPDTINCVKRKRGSLNNEEKVDYISELPDTILSSILSFLPTRLAVQTSLLSKRWKFVWTQVPVLSFTRVPRCQTFLGSTEERKIYNDSMCRAILQHNVTGLKQFRLKSFVRDDESFDAMKWLLNILRWRQYCELNMSFLGKLAPLPLPNEFLSCKTLVVLNLDGFCIDDSKESFNLPNLESVHFGKDIEFPSDHFLKRFLLGCPVLKKLSIAKGCGLGHIYVESSTLMSLEIQSLQDQTNHESPMRITIKTSNLRSLTLIDAYAHYDVDDLYLLTEANLRLYTYRHPPGLDDNLVQLIKKVSWTTTLHLGISKLSRFNDVLPTYENLTHLRFSDDGCGYELLKRSPKLKSLFLGNGGGGVLGKILDCDVPECLSCLEKVELFCCVKDDISVAKYFSKNGSTLKEMVVNVCDSSIEFCRCIRQVLQDGPTSSSICQVKILLHKGHSCIEVA